MLGTEVPLRLGYICYGLCQVLSTSKINVIYTCCGGESADQEGGE